MGKTIDLINQRFGRLVVLEKMDKDSSNSWNWKCKCDCGNEKIISGSRLRRGYSRSCGCLNKEIVSKKQTKNLVNQRFGRLIVVKKIGSKDKNSLWLCICDCGNYKEVKSSYLIKNKTRSCGCLNQEKRKSRSGSNNPNWNPSLTKEDRDSSKYGRDEKSKEWARLVKERNHYLCQICKIKNQNIVSHHILPWLLYKNLRYDLNNGICMCSECHDEYHKMYGKHQNCNPSTLFQFYRKIWQDISFIKENR